MAIAEPFLANGVSKLVTTWFADNERPLATTIGTLATPLGVMLGMSYGTFFVTNDDIKNFKVGKEHTLAFLM